MIGRFKLHLRLTVSRENPKVSVGFIIENTTKSLKTKIMIRMGSSTLILSSARTEEPAGRRSSPMSGAMSVGAGTASGSQGERLMVRRV